MNVPQHPARGAAQPAEPEVDLRGSNNPYYKSNPALAAANTEMANLAAQQQIGLEQAQTAQAYAQADKLAAENAILQQAGNGLGNINQPMAPQVNPMEAQAQELASGIAAGQIDQATLAGLVQSGQVAPEAADAAVNMVRAAGPQPTEAPAQGLGTI